MAILKFLSLFLSLIFFECYSGNPSIDSLQALLKNSLHDSEKVKIIIAISDEYENENPDKALETSEQALALAVKTGNLLLLANAYDNIARKHYSQSNYDLSLLNCQSALELMIKAGDSSSATGVTLLVSSCYMKIGKYKESIETILTFLPFAEKINKPSMLANIYTNLGNVYNYMNRNSDAYYYYLKAIDLMEKYELISPKYVNTLNNTGIIFYSDFQKKPNNKSLIDSSIQYSNKALMVGKKIQYDQGISMALGNIGMAYETIEEYETALKYYLESLERIKKIGNQEGIAFAYNNLGYVYENLGKYEKAMEYFIMGLKIARQLSMPDIVKDSYFGLSETYVKMGDYKKAHENYLLFAQVKDSLFDIESHHQIAEMQTRYETEKKEKQLKIQTLELSKKDSEVKKQRLMIWSVVGGLILVMAFAFFIYSRFRIIRKQKHIIEKQKSVVDEKNKLVEEQKKQIEEKHKETIDSINYAKRIQNAILPSRAQLNAALPDGFLLYKPKDIVAGDFYWMETAPLNPPAGGNINAQAGGIAQGKLPDVHRGGGTCIFIAAADCTGHGVPGALVSVVCSNALSKALLEEGITDTGKLLDRTRELVIERFAKSGEEVKDGMDISLLSIKFNAPNSKFQEGNNIGLGSLNLGLGAWDLEVQWSGANNPLWYFQNGEFKEISADKQPIGNFDNRKPFTTHTIEAPIFSNIEGKAMSAEATKNSADGSLSTIGRVGVGITFYLFTDGYADQFGGPKGKKFKYSQFKNLLFSIQDKSMNEQKDILNAAIEKWRGNLEQVDDICVIGVKV